MNCRLSVIVVSFSDEQRVRRCLDALAADADGAAESETLLVRAADRGALPDMVRAFPAVRVMTAPAGTNVPRLRSTGIAESRGEIVALIEDDCAVATGWRRAVIRAHEGADAAVSGVVDPVPYRRALDWAVFLSDYGRFMPPLAPGPAFALAGNNMSYKRTALERLPRDLARDFQEAFVHRAWQAQGLPMRIDPRIVVHHDHAWSAADAMTVPYHHGRAFAGQRVAGGPLWRRLAMSIAAVPLPALRAARVAGDALSRGRVGPLLVSLPWIIVLAVSWSLGESAGYLLGPGRSLSTWR